MKNVYNKFIKQYIYICNYILNLLLVCLFVECKCNFLFWNQHLFFQEWTTYNTHSTNYLQTKARYIHCRIMNILITCTVCFLWRTFVSSIYRIIALDCLICLTWILITLFSLRVKKMKEEIFSWFHIHGHIYLFYFIFLNRVWKIHVSSILSCLLFLVLKTSYSQHTQLTS